MSVVIYRCPVSANEVRTTIETSNDTLVKMGGMGLAIWVWCTHCVDGHKIKRRMLSSMIKSRLSVVQEQSTTSPDAARLCGTVASDDGMPRDAREATVRAHGAQSHLGAVGAGGNLAGKFATGNSAASCIAQFLNAAGVTASGCQATTTCCAPSFSP